MSIPSLRRAVASRSIRSTFSPTVGRVLQSQRFESTNAEKEIKTDNPKRRQTLPRQRTHILTLPLYNNADLWAKMKDFRERLLKSDPPIEGLDSGNILPRLNHVLQLRLGNLNIKGYEHPHGLPAGEESMPGMPAAEHAEVLKVLHGLKGPIDEILTANRGDGVLRVPLGYVRPLVLRRGKEFDPRTATVVFLAPTEGVAKEKLRAIAEAVRKAFAQAGMWIDVDRPSTLNLTLINTRNTRNREEQVERKPFNLASLYASEAFKAIQARDAVMSLETNFAEPRVVDFGIGVVPGVYLERVGGSGAVERRELPDDGAVEFSTEKV